MIDGRKRMEGWRQEKMKGEKKIFKKKKKGEKKEDL